MSCIALLTNSVSILFEIKYLIKDKRAEWGKTHSVFQCEKSEDCSLWDSVQNGYLYFHIWLLSLLTKESSVCFFQLPRLALSWSKPKQNPYSQRDRDPVLFSWYAAIPHANCYLWANHFSWTTKLISIPQSSKAVFAYLLNSVKSDFYPQLVCKLQEKYFLILARHIAVKGRGV